MTFEDVALSVGEQSLKIGICDVDIGLLQMDCHGEYLDRSSGLTWLVSVLVVPGNKLPVTPSCRCGCAPLCIPTTAADDTPAQRRIEVIAASSTMSSMTNGHGAVAGSRAYLSHKGKPRRRDVVKRETLARTRTDDSHSCTGRVNVARSTFLGELR